MSWPGATHALEIFASPNYSASTMDTRPHLVAASSVLGRLLMQAAQRAAHGAGPGAFALFRRVVAGLVSATLETAACLSFLRSDKQPRGTQNSGVR